MAVGDAAGACREAPARMPGAWSDETAMAMCAAESLLRHGGLDAVDLLDRLRQWVRAGYWSCGEEAEFVDPGLLQVVEAFERGGSQFARETARRNNGAAGDLARIVPVVIYAAAHKQRGYASIAATAVHATAGAGPVAEAAASWAAWLWRALCAPQGTLEPWRSSTSHDQLAPLECLTELAITGVPFREGLIRLGTIALERYLPVRWTPSALGALYGAAAGAVQGALSWSEPVPEDAIEQVAWRRKIARIGTRLIGA